MRNQLCLLISFQPPLAPPVLGEKGKLGGSPRPPSKGAMPLCTPIYYVKGLWLPQLWEEKGKIGGHLHPPMADWQRVNPLCTPLFRNILWDKLYFHQTQCKQKGLSFSKRGLRRFLVETGESRTPRPEERSSESLQAYTAVCSRSAVIRRPISVEPVDVS